MKNDYPPRAPQSRPAYQNPPVSPVQTTERTGKKWKLIQIYAVLLMLSGFGLYFTGLLWLCLGLLVAGVCTYCYAAIGAWWHHG